MTISGNVVGLNKKPAVFKRGAMLSFFCGVFSAVGAYLLGGDFQISGQELPILTILVITFSPVYGLGVVFTGAVIEVLRRIFFDGVSVWSGQAEIIFCGGVVVFKEVFRVISDKNSLPLSDVLNETPKKINSIIAAVSVLGSAFLSYKISERELRFSEISMTILYAVFAYTAVYILANKRKTYSAKFANTAPFLVFGVLIAGAAGASISRINLGVAGLFFALIYVPKKLKLGVSSVGILALCIGGKGDISPIIASGLGIYMFSGSGISSSVKKLLCSASGLFFMCISFIFLSKNISGTGIYELIISSLFGALFAVIIPENLFFKTKIHKEDVNEDTKSIKNDGGVFYETATLVSKTAEILSQKERLVFNSDKVVCEIMDELCDKCRRNKICRGEEFDETYFGMGSVIMKLRRGLRLGREDFPENIKTFCHKTDELSELLSEKYREHCSAENKAREIRHMREMFFSGIYTLSLITQNKEKDIEIKSLQKNFHFDVAVRAKSKERRKDKIEYSNDINTPACGSGDRHGAFYDERGNLYLVVSDGMGSGERAGIDSALCVTLSEKLLSHEGLSVEVALEIINSAMLVKSVSETFATLDILIINPEDGFSQIYKCGGSETYIKCGNQVAKITGEGSYPLGTSKKAVYTKETFYLGKGDIVVLKSDGSEISDVAASTGLLKTIKRTATASQIAQYFFSGGEEEIGNNIQDDITTAAVKVCV